MIVELIKIKTLFSTPVGWLQFGAKTIPCGIIPPSSPFKEPIYVIKYIENYKVRDGLYLTFVLNITNSQNIPLIRWERKLTLSSYWITFNISHRIALISISVSSLLFFTNTCILLFMPKVPHFAYVLSNVFLIHITFSKTQMRKLLWIKRNCLKYRYNRTNNNRDRPISNFVHEYFVS